MSEPGVTSFELRFESAAPPPGVDGRDQARTIRGKVTLPAASSGVCPVVIVAHGYSSFMDWGFLPLISARLAAVGIASLRFNFSGSGIGADCQTMTEPEVFGRNSYLHELEDLRVLHARVRAGFFAGIDPERIAILGHSRGGAMSLVHASEVPGYRAVIAWAAIDRILNFSLERLATWRRAGTIDVMHWTARRRLPLDLATLEAAEAAMGRLDVLAACRRLVCPVLIVAGDADRSVPTAAGRNLAAACGTRGKLLLVAGGDHTFGANHPLREPVPKTLRLVLDETVSHAVQNLSV